MEAGVVTPAEAFCRGFLLRLQTRRCGGARDNICAPKRPDTMSIPSEVLAQTKHRDGLRGLTKHHVDTRGLSKHHVTTRGLTKHHVDTRGLSKRRVDTRGLSKRHVDTRGLSKRHVDTRGLTKHHIGWEYRASSLMGLPLNAP